MMTDEQYIDALFTTEPCGYEKTPGFRAFLLDAMAAIGERPRAGDVASMHMAYRAGMESAPNWTTDRPTEPGEYWVSLQPDRRRLGTAVEPATLLKARRRECVNFTGPLWNCIGSGSAAEELLAVQFDNDLFAKYYDLRAPAFDGAKWSRRETPADPFMEVAK